MIRIEGLSKSFRDGPDVITAVDALTLSVREGEVFGLLGPNGAGKTTTVRLLTGLVAPSSGRAWVNGHEVGVEDQKIRAGTGILTESPGLYERLSAERNLLVFAELYGCRRPGEQVEKYLRLLDLWDRRDTEAGTFSKGMKQKLAIARALVHEPPVVFLDEPTSGLDPEAARTVRDFIETLRGQGRTIVLCTHNLDEAERLCDRVGVFRQRLLALDSPEGLRRRFFDRRTIVTVAASPHVQELAGLVETLPDVGGVEVREYGASSVQLVAVVRDPERQNPEIVRALVGHGAQVQFVDELRHSLEDAYLTVVHRAEERAEGER